MNVGNAANWTQIIWGMAALLVFLVTTVWTASKVYFKLIIKINLPTNVLVLAHNQAK